MAEQRGLRIGLLVDQFPELSETFISGEARALLELGHAVHVESAAHAPNHDAGAADGIGAAYRSDDSRRRRLADMAWLARRHPLRCALDLTRRRRWRREEPVPPLRRLAPPARRLRAFRVDHLHAHFAAGAALDAMRLAAVLGRPYSLMTHGYDIFQSPRNLREKHERAAFAASACDYSVRHVRGLVGGARVERLVAGVDGERFHRQSPHVDGPGIVLAVGRLVEKKGFDVLIEAVSHMPALERLMVVGEGPLRDSLAERARALGVESRVELVGACTPGEVRELMESATVLAAPSVVSADGDRDTMPVVVKEALAMELPVVASDEVGLPEVVRPDWGRLVPPGDAAGLGRALNELLELPAERRAEMGRAGRDFVLAHCELRSEARKLAELIGGASSSGEA